MMSPRLLVEGSGRGSGGGGTGLIAAPDSLSPLVLSDSLGPSQPLPGPVRPWTPEIPHPEELGVSGYPGHSWTAAGVGMKGLRD